MSTFVLSLLGVSGVVFLGQFLCFSEHKKQK